MIIYFSDFGFVGPFRRYSRSKLKVVRNRAKFWTVFAILNFRGQAIQKLYPRYHPWLVTRRVDKKICDDIPISREVIDVHTLNFKPDFKFSRLKFFWGTPVSVGVCAR